eukprot:g38304.t1
MLGGRANCGEDTKDLDSSQVKGECEQLLLVYALVSQFLLELYSLESRKSGNEDRTIPGCDEWLPNRNSGETSSARVRGES